MLARSHGHFFVFVLDTLWVSLKLANNYFISMDSLVAGIALALGIGWTTYKRYERERLERERLERERLERERERAECMGHSLRACGIRQQTKIVEILRTLHLGPAASTFDSTYFLKVKEALNQDPTTKQLFSAVKQIIKNHASRAGAHKADIGEFIKQIFVEAGKHSKSGNGGSSVLATVAAEYMWTSAIKFCGRTELCSMLQEGSLCV